jgi:glyoxylase I family protein
MESVAGIGGLFFRARDPEALSRWYSEKLGINLPPADYDQPVWHQAAGQTVFSPFPDTSDYFGDMGKT